MKKGRTKVCPGGKALLRRGHVSRELRRVRSRSGERCGREGVFRTETVVLLSPEEGESLVLCLKNPEEACVAFPSYVTVEAVVKGLGFTQVHWGTFEGLLYSKIVSPDL